MVEVFDDVAAGAAAHFLARCGSGAEDAFAGTSVHQVLPGLALFGGQRSSRYVHLKDKDWFSVSF